MRTRAVRALALLGATTLVAGAAGHAEDVGEPVLAHVESSFEFTVDAPPARVAPLFGADRERAWAGERWAPRFLYPAPARDVLGEVFTVEHGSTRSTWVNTALDLDAGHVQYVYVVPEAQAVLIDIRLAPEGSGTRVRVVYQRTALQPDANDHVAALGRHDAATGKEWAAAIAAYLAKAPTR